ncbi:MAG: zf-HC2 domain-containing protein [Bryobacteraceae bacterium]|nr:zf-HC2 domain-containing protein [Bryobacteraceae bacterium]MDW8379602.1 anti-sigma factor [Bryobacterales bacterium]
MSASQPCSKRRGTTFLLTCKEFLKELNDYLDDTLDPELRRELEGHAAECPNCWVIFDTSKKTIQIFKGLEPQPLPARVRDRLMAALERKMASKTSAKTRPPGPLTSPQA